MLFNVGKCKVMHLGRANMNTDYYMNSRKLENTSMEKDLGVITTSDLKSSQQCSQSYAKANRKLGMIKRTISHKSTDILLQLYKSLVRPHLEYCTAAWCPHYKDKKLLEKVQKRFTRMIPGLKGVSYEQIKKIEIVDTGRSKSTRRSD